MNFKDAVKKAKKLSDSNRGVVYIVYGCGSVYEVCAYDDYTGDNILIRVSFENGRETEY